MIVTTGFSAADVKLKGTVGSRIIYDNVIIARGTTCVLNGTTINGNIRVLSGAKLYATRARVIGNLEAESALLVDLKDLTEVTGFIQGYGAQSILVRDGTQVGGDVQITKGSAPNGVDALLVRNASVNGVVQAGKCRGRLRVINSTIGGNVQLTYNRRGRFAINRNAVWKDIQYFGNSGKGSIIENSVAGNLQSKENSPRPTVNRNEVRGAVELK